MFRRNEICVCRAAPGSRKTAAEVGHRVLQAIGELARARDRAGMIAEERRHRGGRFQIPLGVGGEPPARRGEVGVVVNAGEDVEKRPRGRRREADAVGRERRHAEGRRQADERLGVALLVATEMALQLDVHAVAAEHADEAIEQAADAVPPAVERRAAGQRDEPGGAAVELVERQRAIPFSARASSCA